MTTGPSALVLVAALCLALSAPLLVWAIGTRSAMDRRHLLENLRRNLDHARAGGELDLAGAPSMAGALASRVLPKVLTKNLDRLHARAGRPANWPMERVVVLKVVLLVVALAAAVVLWRSDPSTLRRVIAVAVFLFVAFLPEALLSVAASRRREVITLALPDTMDQLSIAVEAGLGFEAALNHVSRNTVGPLADEIVRTLQDIQVGVPRREAYTAFAERVGMPDLRRFVRAIIQAEQHGISVAKVLSIQAADMRNKRRLRAEEKAMRIPVMVAFPLFICIFPALLVVVLGPAIINIMDAFGGGMILPDAP